jgi:thiol-disulfide isomerase/thioredoxin
MASTLVWTMTCIMSLGANGESKPQSPKERYEALLTQYDAPQKTYINDQPKAKTATEPFLKLARECPDDRVAVDALSWVVTRTLFTPMAGEAMDLLAGNHIRDERIESLIKKLDRLYGDRFEPYEKLLRAALEKSPHREVRGYACLALGRCLATKKVRIEQSRYQHTLFTKGLNVPFVTEPKESEADLTRITHEAEGLFERVSAEFSDIDGLDKTAKADLYALRNLSVGDLAPEIQGEDADGKPLRLSDYQGKVIVLSLSANWCGPCRAAHPHLRGLVQRLKDEPFALLSVNADEDKATLVSSIKMREITWRCWWDGLLGPICTKWNVAGFPTIYVIDAKGIIRYKGVHDQALDEAVDTLLKECCGGIAR